MNISNDKIVEQLQRILEVTKLLNSSNDVKYILNFLMEATIDLLERADIAVIFLYNKKDKVLRLEASIGFGNIEMDLLPGESITGKSFNMKKTFHLKNHSEMMNMMNTMDKGKMQILGTKIDKSINDIQSSISCPLIHGNECIGVFVIDNYLGKEPFTDEDVYIAELISHHATIAIVNAENYEREIENQKNLKKYSAMIEQEKDRYEYSTFLHNKFTEMVLNGRNIGDILKEVSIMLKRDIFTVDLFNMISYYSLGYFTSIEDLASKHSKLLDKMEERKETNFYFEELSLWVFFYPITVNKEVLSWIGVISNSPGFSELEKIAIDKCATITALEILKNNELTTMEQSLKGDFFDNLLEDSSAEFVNKFAKKFNYNLNKDHQILITKIDSSLMDSSFHRNLKYLYSEINKLAISYFKDSITLMRKNYIVTIFDVNSDLKRESIENFIKKIFKKSEYILSFLKAKFTCRVSVSEIVSDQSNFKVAYENALQLFEIRFEITKNFTFYFYEDLEIKRFLLKNDKKDLENFVMKIMGPLARYKNSSKEELYNTLRIYIINGGNWTLTKEKLHIHGNTLTYRINRLKEILGIDFSNYQDMLKIQIAFEIIELYPEFKV